MIPFVLTGIVLVLVALSLLFSTGILLAKAMDHLDERFGWPWSLLVPIVVCSVIGGGALGVSAYYKSLEKTEIHADH